MKTCTRCKIPKEESEFSTRSDKPGLRCYCKECNCVVVTGAYAENPEPKREYSRRYRSEHPEEILAGHQNWRVQNPGYDRNWLSNKYKTSPSFRVECALRARLYECLTRGFAKKFSSAFSLLGCPVVWLEVHLESLFKPGMTWENYGPIWHIDHVKPCAKFDLTNRAQQQACFHWTNLQPLFAADNLRKSDSYHG